MRIKFAGLVDDKGCALGIQNQQLWHFYQLRINANRLSDTSIRSFFGNVAYLGAGLRRLRRTLRRVWGVSQYTEFIDDI